MTKDEFKRVVEVAEKTEDFSGIDDTILHGLYMPDFKTVHATVEATAKMLHHVAMQMNGNWDSEELNNFASIAKSKIQIVG